MTKNLYMILLPLLSMVHNLFQSASTQAAVTLHWIPLSLNLSLLILLILYMIPFGEICCFVNRAIFILLKWISRSITIREDIFPLPEQLCQSYWVSFAFKKTSLKIKQVTELSFPIPPYLLFFSIPLISPFCLSIFDLSLSVPFWQPEEEIQMIWS